MGEKCPEASSQEPEGEKAKQGRLHNIGEEGDSSAGNHRGVQALVEIFLSVFGGHFAQSFNAP